MSERIVNVVPITADAFAPYGWLFTGQAGDPAGGAFRLQRLADSDFSGGRPLMAMITLRWRDFCFTHMEQHSSFTQAFLPADGAPAVIVVAQPSAGLGSEPDLDTLQAFLLDGTQGIMYGRGIWHTPVFPLVQIATYAMTTCIDTQPETEGYLDISPLAGGPIRIGL